MTDTTIPSSQGQQQGQQQDQAVVAEQIAPSTVIPQNTPETDHEDLGWSAIFGDDTATIPVQPANVAQETPAWDPLASADLWTLDTPMVEVEQEIQPVSYQDIPTIDTNTFPVQETAEEISSPLLSEESEISQTAEDLPEEGQLPEEINQEDMQTIQHQASLEQTQMSDLLDTKLHTDIQKKFGELFFTTKRIRELKTQIGEEETAITIIWADNDKVYIAYDFLVDETIDPMVFITKTEQDKETESESVNELKFSFNEGLDSIEVMINDTLLFDEAQDLMEDAKKKMQVMDKINKFIFLASQELIKVEKIIKLREEEEHERKKLQDIFRNF